MATEQEIIDWIRLINSENIGPVTFYKLLSAYQTAAEALAHLPAKSKAFPRSEAVREYELAQSQGIKILLACDPEYPQNLRTIDDCPPVLYVKGRTDIFNHPLSLAVVGARNASVNGRKLASKISFDLTNENIVIVSGMARGIDTAAHRGALYAQNRAGTTIAVLGTGIDIIYPKENSDLYEQIAAQGAVISELPLGTEAQANNFPRRNRIVSALANGTLVVEATLHSGSLITARLAMEQGRDVFAIPGFPTEPRSAGPNKLIKDGAVLVENAEDIINTFNLTNHRQIQRLTALPNADLFSQPLDKGQKTADIPFSDSPLIEKHILPFLSREGSDIDSIIRDSGLDSATVSLQLLELELEGRIERQVGNKVALIK